MNYIVKPIQRNWTGLIILMMILSGCAIFLSYAPYQGSVLFVTQLDENIIVENISNNPVAIRISWDNKDPWGTGAEGSDSYIDAWVEPHDQVIRKIKKHHSVQVWAWGESRWLVDECSLAIR